jgi:Uma2 family endonuclease
MSDVVPSLPSKDGEPAWEAAYLHPPQGRWSEEDFLKFHTSQMAELVDGRLEILPMPNLKHQRMLLLLLDLMRRAMPIGGTALFAPLPSRLFPGTIREPDLLYISPDNRPADDVEYPTRLDLVMEIVSRGEDAKKRDYVDKRRDYAKAGITEYWIIDPEESMVTVLALRGEVYEELGCFKKEETASGELLGDLAVDVTALMSA